MTNRRTSNPEDTAPTDESDRIILLEAELTDPPDTRLARLLVTGAIAAIFAAILWAYHAPVKEVVVGEGRILPQSERHVVQHKDGGRIEEVYVREGDVIEAGAPLVRFDRSDERALVAQLDVRAAVLEGELARARALASGTPYETLPSELPGTAVTSAQAAAYETQIAARKAREELLGSDVEVARARLSETEESIRHLMRREEIHAARFKDLQWLSGDRGVVSGRDRDAAEISLIETRGELAAATTRARTASLELDRARSAVVEFTLSERRASLELASELEARLAEARKEIERYATIAERDTLYAPVRARIQSLQVTGADQVVQPGGEVAALVPLGQELLAQLTVPADSIGRISPGHSVNIKVLTFDFSRFGTIAGRVVDVSPTSDVSGDGSSAYRVRVALAKEYVGTESAALQLRPGLAVVGDIVLGERTVLEYLLKPLRAVNDRALTES